MDEPVVVHGLTVQAYAAVYAATAEGFPLELVLDQIGILPEAWPRIDEEWITTLAEDLDQEGTLGDTFETALLRAQDSYRRPIPPLDEDATAWIRFARAWAAASDPLAFLRHRGLEQNDLVRLQRYWAGRLADEPELRKTVAEVMLEEDPAPPPMRKPVPLELRLPARRTTGTIRMENPKAGPPPPPSILAALPSAEGPIAVPVRAPVSVGIEDGLATAVETRALVIDEDGELVPPSVDVTMPGQSSPFDSVRLGDDFELPAPESVTLAPPMDVGQDLSLVQYASLRAELEAFPDQEEAIFAKYGLASLERRAKVDAEWQERLGNETGTYAEWRQLHKHFTEHWEALARGA
jgi:hypothetical protein